MGRSLEQAMVVVLCAVAATVLLGVPLALAGWFRPATVVPAVGLATVALVWCWTGAASSWAGQPDGPRWQAAAAVALSLASGALSMTYAAQHVLVDRDPAVYAGTAKWLAEHGDLTIELGAPEGISLEPSSPGFHDVSDGVARPQFLHGTAALAAAPAALLGDRAIFLTGPALSVAALLAFYLLATRWVGPTWALAAQATLAASLPFAWLSRDLYSEIPCMTLLLGGLWMLDLAVERVRPSAGLVAGLVLGTTFVLRIDAAFWLIGMPVWALVSWIHRRPLLALRRRVVAAVALGGALGPLVGAVDGLIASPQYLIDHRGQILSLWAVTGFVAIACVAVAPSAVRRHLPRVTNRRLLGRVAALALVMGAAYLAFVRPHIPETAEQPSPFVADIQEQEGLDHSPDQHYRSNSFRWLVWYLGPLVAALAVTGAAAAVHDLPLSDSSSRGHRLPLIVGFLVTTSVYLWRPSAVADHPWVMRRFIVLTIPVVIILATWSLTRLGRKLSRPALAGALAAALPILPLIGLLPVRRAQDMGGYHDEVVAPTCATIGPDAAVVVLEGLALERTLPSAIRIWCDVPAVAGPALSAPATVRAWQATWPDRNLYLVGADVGALEAAAPGGRTALIISHANDRRIEQTLASRPDELVEQAITFRVRQVGR